MEVIIAHVIILMDEAIDAMKGDASTGSLADLRSNCDSVDYKLEHNLLPPLQRTPAHNKLNEIQDWLLNNSTVSSGAKDMIDGFNTDLSAWA